MKSLILTFLFIFTTLLSLAQSEVKLVENVLPQNARVIALTTELSRKQLEAISQVLFTEGFEIRKLTRKQEFYIHE
jgi:predicted metal-dependent hydrolase